MRSLLPSLIDFDCEGRSEYLEDFVAQIDAPRVISVKTALGPLDFVPVPQLFLFIRITVRQLKYIRLMFLNRGIE